MGKYDIIVGIPTYNEGDSVGFVVKQVDAGLRKYYPKKKGLIVCCDGNSQDNTKKAFSEPETKSDKKFMVCKLRGKGNGFKMLFKQVVKHRPEATVVVDADLKSINPEWMRLMAGPILKGYDYLTPVYVRERYDATITNHVAYPVVYGILGRNIRQPIAGDFSFSSKLAKKWLKYKWTKETGMYGIDIFMTTHAILNESKLCQANLGYKIHKPSAPKLNDMFLQVARSLFDAVFDNMDRWINDSHVVEEKIFGMKTLPEPRKLKPSSEKIIHMAFLDYNRDALKKYLTEETFKTVNSMFFHRNIRIDEELWSKIMYEMMYSYHTSRYKNGIIKCLRPLYFARVYTFFKEIPEYTTEQVEADIRGQAKTFRNMRGVLVDRLKSES